MRNAIIFTGLAALSTLTPMQALSSTKELESAIYKVIPFGGQPYVALDTRKEYATALLAYWNDFDSRIPRLSPSENEWIKKEMGAHGERLNRALNTREFALFSLALNVDNCVSSLGKLNAAYEDSAKAQTEMFLWLGMARCYSNMDTMMNDLQRAGLSNGKFDGSFYAVGSSLVMRALLDKVIPSAMADTMGWTISAD